MGLGLEGLVVTLTDLVVLSEVSLLLPIWLCPNFWLWQVSFLCLE